MAFPLLKVMAIREPPAMWDFFNAENKWIGLGSEQTRAEVEPA
jgi:hypothetical protein